MADGQPIPILGLQVLAMHAEVKVGNSMYQVRYAKEGGLLKIDIAGRQYVVDAANSAANSFSLLIDNQSYDAIVDGRQDSFSIVVQGETLQVDFFDPRSRQPADALEQSRQAGQQTILAPMAGQIIKVSVNKGALVKAGDGLIVLEAMKMENELKSRGVGEVQEVFVSAGDIVTPGQKLLIIA